MPPYYGNHPPYLICMQTKISKKSILAACFQKQDELIKRFEERVSMMKADTYSRSESASQRENRTAGKIELLSTYENELGFAKAEMEYLRSLDSAKVNSIAEPGAVVITNHLVFFIGVSTEKVEVEGQLMYGISTEAPLYKAMQGLGKGQTFAYNEKEYLIEEVY